MKCKLCLKEKCLNIDKEFYQCSFCGLTFKDASFYLTEDQEKARYENHENSLEDRGYVGFLNRAIEPALKYLDASMLGLDYGSGPGPTLHKLLGEKKIKCENYDPFFYENNFKSAPYDFVFSTETFEHFHDPKKEILTIKKLLKPGGYLIVMTEFIPEDFENWYYKKDPTHVCFYNEATFDYLCSEFGFKKLYSDQKRVILFLLQ